MPNFICTTCGTQFAETDQPPTQCKICTDERQFVGWNGQQWTTLDDLRDSHRNVVRLEELGLYGIGMEPSFAIGQRALLVTHPDGNVLWDCIPLLDEGLIEMVEGIGGISAIAISHPHYYTSMVEWSRAFDCPIYLHIADQQWVMRPDPAIEFWEGETKGVSNGLTLVRCGGHFDGGTVLHWPEGAGGKGVILSGDILQVVQDRRWVSFMYSYPNLIPLPASKVNQIVEAVGRFEFDRIYGAWWGKTVFKDAKAAVKRSADRYVRAIEDGSMDNLFANVPTNLPEELIDVLAENQNVRIERIVSTGHASPEGFWYDQKEHEWVVVLKGEAKLRFENDEPVHLKPGDHLLVPAHRKHRVEWTTPDEPTVWLAVFYSE